MFPDRTRSKLEKSAAAERRLSELIAMISMRVLNDLKCSGRYNSTCLNGKEQYGTEAFKQTTKVSVSASQQCPNTSEVLSLACILYEMCCMNHAFTGSNFLSIVLKIVEGDTPSLPERYSRELNSVMECMLNKNPSLRPSAIEILKIPYIDEQLQHLMCRYSEMTLEDKNLNCQKEATHIVNAVQKKIHLQTLRALSEVQKMTPRERMRLRKLQAADEKARRLKKLVEEKYEENNKRMQELRSRNFQQLSVDVLHEFDDSTSENLPESQPVPSPDLSTLESSVEDTIADPGDHGMSLHQYSEGCSQLTHRLMWLTDQYAWLASERSLGCMWPPSIFARAGL
ncbi:hypothetical protein HPG69_013038 [Diceros bicornis minor]|uniref:non-specific serine/threonine protein kinase n=1 Tax=Diceros bicornis minor TaxID=77932 RepID=A0A7J7F250_DICBM|nr:hypothetical protein HPG69_013038 [Diceros bicornis minor]